MDFFARQDKARHNTRLLVVYFTVGVGMLIVSVYLAVCLIVAGTRLRHERFYEEDRPQISLWNPQLFFGAAIGTLSVIALGSLFKTAELSQGGRAVATMLGGRLVNLNTTDPDERKLLNVVEEMAIAAGLPVPQVYIMDEENGINAFAAGHTASDAVVSVTRGAIKYLSRDELQGVIGHEFSHILNGDMRLNLRLMGLIFGILCLAVIGRILLQTRGRSERGRNPLPLLGLALLLIGWIGVFFGRLIQAAVSRQRECLADASAVQFTRNPAGLAGALKKIGGASFGSRIEAPHAEEASHLFFSNAMGQSFFHLLDTHPPLIERIRELDPSFDGLFPRVSITEIESPAGAGVFAAVPPALAGVPAFLSGAGRPEGRRDSRPTSFVPRVGTPTIEHLSYAAQVRDSFSEKIKAAARDPLGAGALIYGLVFSDKPEIRQQQLQLLAQTTSDGIRQETERLQPEIDEIAHQAKLPLVNLALPALRHFSPSQYEQFKGAIQKLIECDGEIDLFEYMLQKIVLRHLEPQFGNARKPLVQYYAIKPLAEQCEVLLSALAYAGQQEPDKIEAAFRQGAQLLEKMAQTELRIVPAAACELSQVDAALERLSQAVPQIKKNVLEACAEVVAADGVIQEVEAELLRAVADTLDCPIPPALAA